MATITIDGKKLDFEAGLTILEAAKRLRVHIPTLCYNEHLTPYGGCRVCLVETASQGAAARARLVPACTAPAEDGMVVATASSRVLEARRFIIALLLSRCPGSEQIQALAAEAGLAVGSPDLDLVSRYLIERAPRRDDTHCILCALCVRVCAQVPERHALSLSARGIRRKAISPFGKVAESCIGCGSCAYVCPTKTITVEEASQVGG